MRWTAQVRVIRCAAAATVHRHELVDHAPSKPGRGEGKRPRRRDPWRAGAVADGRRDSDGRVEEQQHLHCSIVRSSDRHGLPDPYHVGVPTAVVFSPFALSMNLPVQHFAV